MKTALILFAHGARDPEWANPMRRVQAAVQARQPGVPVELAFLEFMSPTLSESIAGLLAGGVDAILIETCQDLGQIKARELLCQASEARAAE